MTTRRILKTKPFFSSSCLIKAILLIFVCVNLAFNVPKKCDEYQIQELVPGPQDTLRTFNSSVASNWDLLTKLKEEQDVAVIEKKDEMSHSTLMNAVVKFYWSVPDKDNAMIIDSKKSSANFKVIWPESSKITFKLSSGKEIQFVLSTSPIKIIETTESPTIKVETVLQPGEAMLVVPVQLGFQLIENNKILGHYYLRDEVRPVLFRKK